MQTWKNRRPSRWYASTPTFCSSTVHKKNILTAFVFTNRVLLINSCICMYFPHWFWKMAIIISYSHFVNAAFVSSLVCRTFDRMILSIEWVFLEQGVFKVVRGDNTGLRNGTWSEKVWNHCSIRRGVTQIANNIFCNFISSFIDIWTILAISFMVVLNHNRSSITKKIHDKKIVRDRVIYTAAISTAKLLPQETVIH